MIKYVYGDNLRSFRKKKLQAIPNDRFESVSDFLDSILKNEKHTFNFDAEMMHIVKRQHSQAGKYEAYASFCLMKF